MISLKFQIEGHDAFAPKEWQDLRERYEFGTISNQPLIDSERFTFVGDAARIIFEHYNNGYILRGIPVSLISTQRDQSVDLFKDYIIDLTDNPEFIEPDFNGEFSPKEVIVSIKKANGIGTLINDLEGVTWGFLDAQGKVNSNDYVTVKTAVMKLYNALDLALAIIALYVIEQQLEQLIAQTQQDAADAAARLTGLDPAAKVGAIIYIALLVLLRAAVAILLLASLITAVVNIIALLVPPIVKNKAMTWRRGYEIIFDYLGYKFVSDLEELDIEVILPSKPRNLTGNILIDLIPTFPANHVGYPNANDIGYLAIDYVGLGIKRFNARFDVEGDTVVMRWENDQSLLRTSTFRPAVNVSVESKNPNIGDIPQTRILSFLSDNNDDYTTINYQGTKYEVKNLSKYQSFKGLERIDLGLALGNAKTELNNVEKFIVKFASIADKLAGLLGVNPNLASTIKRDRVNILKVSSNNYSVPKLIPLVNGGMNANNRNITSARAIENKYYINRSIVRGTGQKHVIPNYVTTFNIKNREEILNNGRFVDDKGNIVTIKNLEYQYSSDRAEGEIQIDYNYIARGDVEEAFFEPF